MPQVIVRVRCARRHATDGSVWRGPAVRRAASFGPATGCCRRRRRSACPPLIGRVGFERAPLSQQAADQERELAGRIDVDPSPDGLRTRNGVGLIYRHASGLGADACAPRAHAALRLLHPQFCACRRHSLLSRGRRAGGEFRCCCGRPPNCRSWVGRSVSACARRRAASYPVTSAALAIPPCAADHATGFSRNRRTSASATSEKYGRSRHASSTSHQLHR